MVIDFFTGKPHPSFSSERADLPLEIFDLDSPDFVAVDGYVPREALPAVLELLADSRVKVSRHA